MKTDILLVEPDNLMSSLVADSFAVEGYRVHRVKDAQGAVDWLDNPGQICRLVILELFLGEHSGVEFIHELKSYEDWNKIPLVVHTKADILSLYEPEHLSREYGIEKVVRKSTHSIRELLEHVSAKVASQ